MKSTRQNDIIRIISDKEIEKQEELAGELRALGYQVTQATISRDIKDLHLIKVIGESGKYKYAQPDRNRSAVNVNRAVSCGVVTNVNVFGRTVKR